MRPIESRPLIGDSPIVRKLREEIAGAARTSAKVLIVGETGVGKEIVARHIHEQSQRAGATFVPVNCSGIAETLLESELFGHARGSFTGADRETAGLLRQAHRGTLFLDELGEMSTRMQAVLLRFTETGEIHQVGSDRPGAKADVRLIAATNRDLREQVAQGAFRQDLYYRLNVIHIAVPPLRARGDDIELLIDYYLQQAAASHLSPIPALAADTFDLLRAYSWPGNVRELKNITERLVLLGLARPLTPDDLPDEILGYGAGTARDRSLGHFGGAAAMAPSTQVGRTRSGSPGEPEAPHRAGVRGGDPACSARPATDFGEMPVTDFTPDTVTRLWDRMAAGEDFWSVVYRAFKARELTRTDLAALIDRGLHTTGGSYTALLKLFNLPSTDYKRFHAFLYQQECNLPVSLYRRRGTKHAAAANGRLRVA